MTSYGERRWGKPPPGYIPGLGRGAVGFVTRLDIGPARNIIFNQPEQEKPSKETKSNNIYGYEEKLFNKDDEDEEDLEADKQYEDFDKYMEERRKNVKEKNELLNLKRNRNEQPTIRQTFSALKNELKTLSQSDWESIPEIKDFTLKKRKIERYIPITDSEIIAALNDTIIPLKEEKETTLENVGKAKNSILKMLIDKIGEEKDEKNSVDRLSYLTELNTLNKDNIVNPLNSFEGVQDMKKAKLLLNNLITTNSKNPLSWISAARLEMMDNDQIKAREILSKAIENIKDSEDLWIEYSRLYDNDPIKAKDILKQGIMYLPKSEKIYIELVKIEKNNNEKKKILKKCLFEELSTSEILWKMLIELEKNNPELYKRLLLKCTEYFPKSINNWIILSKQCDYEEGKQHLLKAIKLNEDSLHIRIYYMLYEEKAKKIKENELKEIFNNIIEEMKDKKITNEEFISFACDAEKSNCLLSNKIIINYTLTNFKKNSTYKETKNTFKKIIEELKEQEYKYIFTIKQIYITLLQLNDNKDIELWVQYIDYIKTNISIDEIEKIFKEAIEKASKDVYKETFYLLYAKILKENNDIDKAISSLKEGYRKINRENILFALVKLYDMKNLYKDSISLLLEGKNNKKYENNHEIIINLVKEYININDIEQALYECKFGIKKFPFVDEFYLLNADLLSLKEKNYNIKEEKEKNKFLEEASAILRNGIKLIPQSNKLYIKLSNILFQLGQINQARAIIDKGLGNKNLINCSILYKEQILLEMKIGNKNIAKNLLSKALKKFENTKDEDLFKELEEQINQN